MNKKLSNFSCSSSLSAHNQGKPKQIQVCVRFRPVENPKNYQTQNFFFSESKKTVRYLSSSSPSSPSQHPSSSLNKEFTDYRFDEVFDQEADQKEIYEKTTKSLLLDVLQGVNCTVLAYGQTGSGKTFTMLGNQEEGIIPRVAKDLFFLLKGKKVENQINKFEVSISAIEIYLENIRDLFLDEENSLKLRQDKSHHFFVENCIEQTVHDSETLLKFIKSASFRRISASTLMNKESSRSHAVFTIYIKIYNSQNISRRSKLVLVDLAGSEVNKKTIPGMPGSTSGDRYKLLNQSKMINKSLSALGNVVKALSEKKAHVPYRDSKLTRLLRDSIGGTSKTRFILTCSNEERNVSETLSTLRFGRRAKSVENRVMVEKFPDLSYGHSLNRFVSSKEQERIIQTLRKNNMELLEENKRLKNEIVELKSGKEEVMSSGSESIESLETRKYKPKFGFMKKEEPDVVETTLWRPRRKSVSSTEKIKSLTKARNVLNGFKGKKKEKTFDGIMVDMTKKLIDVKLELSRKQEELTFANRMLEKKSQKYFKMGILTNSSSTVNTKEFMEVIKRKDLDIVRLKKNVRELEENVCTLQNELIEKRIEITQVGLKLEEREARVKYLEDELQASMN
eukprot:snap_masked-scaffold_6-processed-gene-0.19-mRNA-1 protein AED:0.32 eAED:0.32 QI:0/-1/0/1/-1/1/1/0/621